jgi:hypothetical protein
MSVFARSFLDEIGNFVFETTSNAYDKQGQFISGQAGPAQRRFEYPNIPVLLQPQ